MDTEPKIKEEESLPDGAASQSETEFFHKVVSMKRDSNAVLLDDHCDERHIKSEAPFPKHFVKQIKSKAVICSSNWKIDRKAKIDEETLISDFGSQSDGELLSEDPVTKLGKFNSGHEIGNKIEIKEEPLWLEIEASHMYDDIKDGDFPPVKSSRLCTEGIYSAVSGKSPLIGAEISERDTSCYSKKDNPEYERQKSDVIERPSAEECAVSDQPGKRCEGEKWYMRPLGLKQKTLIRKSIRSHKCKTCQKSFSQLSHLKSHYLIHEGKKPHKCKRCDKSFTDLSNLKRHYLIHEGKKPHKCKRCDKSFTDLSNLKRHYLIHEGKKPHKCKTCDKSFTHFSHLKRPYLIHEGRKPHKCKTCDKSFTHFSHLKRHYFIHEGKKPHKCKTCDKSFTLLSHLKRHYLIHEGKKPHKCKTCDKSFTDLSYLKIHYLIHEGKKPYSCKTCDKRFGRLSSLKRHYFIHKGDMPHKCTTCDKTFTDL